MGNANRRARKNRKVNDVQLSSYMDAAIFETEIQLSKVDPDLMALLTGYPVDEKQDSRVDLSEISTNLLASLRALGQSYGPLGVARAAAGLTDIDVLIRNLGGVVPADVIDVPSMDAKKWTTPALLNLLGAVHDELDRRGVDLNEQPEYTNATFDPTKPTRGLSEEDRRHLRREDARRREDRPVYYTVACEQGDAQRALAGDRIAEKRLIDAGFTKIDKDGTVTYLKDWTKEVVAPKDYGSVSGVKLTGNPLTDMTNVAEAMKPNRAPCPTLTRHLEGIALRAARKAISDHLGED